MFAHSFAINIIDCACVKNRVYDKIITSLHCNKNELVCCSFKSLKLRLWTLFDPFGNVWQCLDSCLELGNCWVSIQGIGTG